MGLLVRMCENDIYKINIPDIIRYVGLGITIAGILLFLIVLARIKTLESYKCELITTVLYAIIRHPMYLSFIMWMIGYAIFHQALISFLISFILTANVLYWKRLEE